MLDFETLPKTACLVTLNQARERKHLPPVDRTTAEIYKKDMLDWKSAIATLNYTPEFRGVIETLNYTRALCFLPIKYPVDYHSVICDVLAK